MLSRLLSTFLALTLMGVVTNTLEPVGPSELAILTATDTAAFDSEATSPTSAPVSEEEEEDESPAEDDAEDSDRDDRDEESRSELERALLASSSFDVRSHRAHGDPALTTKARAALHRSALPNGFPREEERPPDA